ncbi:hypothetical protein NE237_012912 [Protea cynaroides]|uniref:Bifunctional inhibitor/plant lipid transfer protein/seed storage helical domain-containing protein n=1 Tax=Protea cynaroides TaxID=273540 RepID=A0A9Q0GYW1_9MAGN|nr:hypothetical protein NE237_012912 [Protea cynaroides]
MEKHGIVMLVMIAILLGNELMVVKSQSICKMSGQGLMACKPSVTPPNPPPPTRDCCQALSHADLKCLCGYKNSSVLPALGIDPNLAMQLPEKCKLPKPSTC